MQVALPDIQMKDVYKQFGCKQSTAKVIVFIIVLIIDKSASIDNEQLENTFRLTSTQHACNTCMSNLNCVPNDSAATQNSLFFFLCNNSPYSFDSRGSYLSQKKGDVVCALVLLRGDCFGSWRKWNPMCSGNQPHPNGKGERSGFRKHLIWIKICYLHAGVIGIFEKVWCWRFWHGYWTIGMGSISLNCRSWKTRLEHSKRWSFSIFWSPWGWNWMWKIFRKVNHWFLHWWWRTSWWGLGTGTWKRNFQHSIRNSRLSMRQSS